MVYQAVRFWIADSRIHADDVETIAKGVQLEPGNASAWDTLGRYQQLDFINSKPAQALESYKQAVRDDPRSAAFRMNLAAAYEADGDIPHAREQFEKAARSIRFPPRLLGTTEISYCARTSPPKATPRFSTPFNSILHCSLSRSPVPGARAMT